jgi:hypothetical protein
VKASVATICMTLVLALPFSGSLLAAAPTPEEVAKVTSFLFVQNTNSGSFQDDRLTFSGTAPVLFFSDRPYRISGHTTLEHFIDAWDSGKGSFAEDPPNAVLSILGENVESFVVVLSAPELTPDGVSYRVAVDEGTIPQKFKDASLFIDNNLWAAVGGLAVGRISARRSAAKTAAAYGAGQKSAQQDQKTYYQAGLAPPAAPVAPAATPAAPSATATPEQKLDQLKQMLDKGLITQDEYNKKKSEIMAAL